MSKKFLLLVYSIILVFVIWAFVVYAEGEVQTGSVQGTVVGQVEVPPKYADDVENFQEKAAKTDPMVDDRLEKPVTLINEDGTQEVVKAQEETANGGLELSKGLAGTIVKVGDYATTTNKDGSFKINDLPAASYSYQIIVGDSVTKEGTVEVEPGETIKIGEEVEVNLEDIQKAMGDNMMAFDNQGTSPQTHTHGGAPHCNKRGTPWWSGAKFPKNNSDCSWALFVKWDSDCINEAMKNDDRESGNRYCNGNGKVWKYYAPDGYTGWHGVSCSYKRGHREFDHYN